ncbi:MAG TPA: sialidase family protein [Candidatus Dormibacteraeota bacterium]|nr:sialidase family protein [Candidatus Dormibacteraeota bacterium]
MKRRILYGLAFAALVLGMVVSTPIPSAAEEGHHIKKAAKGQERAPVINTGTTVKTAPSLSAGLLQAASESLDRADADSGEGSLSVSKSSLGCAHRNTDSNVRVNQDCTFRRQAEEGIAVNPADPTNLVAGQNDSRIGFNHCGIDYSFDSGRTWGDQLPPFWQRLNWSPAAHSVLPSTPAIRTYDAASDPAIAFDSQGRAFFSCVVFDINDNANGVLVASSPVGAGGSFFNNIPAGSPTSSRYVAAEDNNDFIVHDKEFITADSTASSPFRDNVYVTWSVFKFMPSCVKPGNPGGYCSSKIYFSRSTDHAVTWSRPTEISGTSSTLCFFGNFFDTTQSSHACDFDQGSDPVVLPNGNIVVVFNNGNTAATNPNSQQLAVTSTDGGNTWSHPVKVGDDVTVAEPLCNFGRGPEECIPGVFIRTNDFPRLAVNRGNGHLFSTWQDYRNGEFDIQLASSTDGGKTWTVAAHSVNPDSGKDHYFGAVAVVASGSTEDGDNEGGNGDRVGDSYYRTDRVANENTTPTGGFTQNVGTKLSDYTLAGGRGLSTPYATVRVSPIFGPPDGIQAGFNGDYSGLALAGTTAHPIWSDTRNSAPAGQGVTHDEDVFTDSVPLPGGHD